MARDQTVEIYTEYRSIPMLNISFPSPYFAAVLLPSLAPHCIARKVLRTGDEVINFKFRKCPYANQSAVAGRRSAFLLVPPSTSNYGDGPPIEDGLCSSRRVR